MSNAASIPPNEQVAVGSGFGVGEIMTSLNAAVPYQPDASKAYLRARFSVPWPVVTFYGECLSPATVARSFHSALHTPVNLDHKIRAYDPERIARDRIVGCIIEAEVPSRHSMIASAPDEGQGIQAWCSIFKKSETADRVLGKHLTGRSEFAVSMEVSYGIQSSGFLLKSADKLEGVKDATPDEWRRHGCLYVPASAADEELLATRCLKRSSDGTYQAAAHHMRDRKRGGRGHCGYYRNDVETYWLMGGLDGTVTYTGLGVVAFGAEPTAQIEEVLAADQEAEDVARFLTAACSIFSAGAQQ